METIRFHYQDSTKAHRPMLGINGKCRYWRRSAKLNLSDDRENEVHFHDSLRITSVSLSDKSTPAIVRFPTPTRGGIILKIL